MIGNTGSEIHDRKYRIGNTGSGIQIGNTG